MQEALTDETTPSQEGAPPAAPVAEGGNAVPAPEKKPEEQAAAPAAEKTETTSEALVSPTAHAMSREEYKKNHFKTDGEKKFDSRTYRFWGYYVNVAVSLLAVWWAERTHTGQGTIRWLGDRFKGMGINREWAEYLGTKSFFLAGGFAVIPPMKWLEDKKVALVKQYNRQIYGDKADKDPKIVQSEAEVEAQPKQTWASVISARFLALIPFYITVGLLWSHKSPLAKWTNGNIRSLKKAEVDALEIADPKKFAGGIFFDRPITWVARWIGRAVGAVTGRTEAVAQIKHLQETSPAIMRSPKGPGCDPMLSTGPYYFISEAITSAAVAWGIYVITRITGPLFGANKDQRAQMREGKQELHHKHAAPAPENPPPKADDKKPDTKVDIAGLERQQAAPVQANVAR